VNSNETTVRIIYCHQLTDRNKLEESLKMTDWTIALLFIMLTAFIGQTAILYRKIGKIEELVKRSCPFGSCPFFKSANMEAQNLMKNVKNDSDT